MIDEILRELGVDVNTIEPCQGEVYALTMNDGNEINLHIDDKNWLHAMSEFSCSVDEKGIMYKQLAWFNDFNVSHPQLIMGVNRDNEKIVLHSRFHCENTNRVKVIEFFEVFTLKLNEIKNFFN
ncbi:hypothetical protein C7420_102507 [Pantoea ananatis]|jgi:hypothetical protein|nr:hypothetical protein [Pantoea ananatis]PQK79966.1 hypothetical protein CG428_00935 [Pantoea ananatis]RAR73464.1 hypothetical protein C7420_102507 [Pantoea ananatis]